MAKLLIIGNGRHGKDTAAEILSEHFNMSFNSSSWVACEVFIFNALKDKYGYDYDFQCFEDRVNRRKEWYDLICEYNRKDPARLAKEILERSDCYVGMRSREEIKVCKGQGLFDLIIWIDASERLPLEPKDSFDIDRSLADVVVENNGTLNEFESKIKSLGKLIFK